MLSRTSFEILSDLSAPHLKPSAPIASHRFVSMTSVPLMGMFRRVNEIRLSSLCGYSSGEQTHGSSML